MIDHSDITVVIPLYNREQLIEATLDSVLGQTAPAASVIVVDDGSTDGSADAVSRFGARVTLVRNGRQGVQAARNAGMALARTPWVALCDSDDIWEPRWLERVGDLCRAEPSVDFVFGNFRFLRDGHVSDTTKFDAAPPGFWDRLECRKEPHGWMFGVCIAGETFRWHPIFPSATVLSKALMMRSGTFNVALNGARNEDGEFTVRQLYHARAAAIPEPLVQIRKHRESVSADQLNLLIDEVNTLDFTRRTHAQAQPYRDIIDGEIVRRTVEAADIAFSVGDHGLVRTLSAQVPWRNRPAKLAVKRLVASLPDHAGRPLNHLLQRIAGR